MQTSSSSSVAAPTTLRISDSMFNAPDSRASTHEVTAQRWSKRVTPLGALPPSTLHSHCSLRIAVATALGLWAAKRGLRLALGEGGRAPR